MSSTSSSPAPTTAKTLEPFVCGGSAAIIASCVVHPVDLVKVSKFESDIFTSLPLMSSCSGPHSVVSHY